MSGSKICEATNREATTIGVKALMSFLVEYALLAVKRSADPVPGHQPKYFRVIFLAFIMLTPE